MRSIRRLLILVVLPFLLELSIVACYNIGKTDAAVVVSSKDFTESFILGEMYASVLENAGIKVQRKLNLGGTPVAQAGLLSGQIDVYPEYTGTALLTVLKLPQNNDPKQVYDTVAQAYKDQFNLIWLDPSVMNSTSVMAVTRNVAQQYGLKTMSDMIANASKLRIVTPPEFLQREDGLPGLKKLYGNFDFKEVVTVDPGLRYQAIASGRADAVLAFSTDGELSVTDLVPLKDDRKYYPPYQVAPVVRATVLEAHPAMRDALNVLAPKITDETMRQLNYEVSGKQREPAEVAQEFLRQEGLWQQP
jgi:osmoprotectant transport system substrate-binding protein